MDTGSFEAFVALLIARRRAVVTGFAALFLLCTAGIHRLQVDFRPSSFFRADDPKTQAFLAHEARWGPEHDPLMVLLDSPAPARIDAPRLERHLAAVKCVGDVALESDETPMVLAARLVTNVDDASEVRRCVQAVREALDFLESESIHATLAGTPATRAEFIRLTISEQFLFFPLALLAMGAALRLIFRGLHGVLVPLLLAVLPTLMLAGLMGWFGEPVGLLNQVYFTLIPAIAIADAIHFLARYHERATRAGPPALTHTMNHVGRACLVTSFTTAAAFASLGFSGIEVVRSFGLFAACGTLFAYGTMMALLPSLLPRAGRELDAGPTSIAVPSTLALRHRSVVLGMAVVLSAACLWQARGLDDRTSLTGILGDDHPVTRATRAIGRDRGGVLGVDLAVAFDPVAWETPACQASWHRVGSSWADRGATRMAQEARDGTHGRIRLRVPDWCSERFGSELSKLERSETEALAPCGAKVRATGRAAVAYHSLRAMVTEVERSLYPALAVVGLTLLVLFRRPLLALATMAVNLIPLGVGAAFMVWMGWPLELGPAVVFCVGLGIAVDDTIHITSRFIEERARGLEATPAMEATLRGSGRAVAISSAVLALGFGLHAFASLPGIMRMGSLGAVLVLGAWAADVFVLGPLLTFFEGDSKR